MPQSLRFLIAALALLLAAPIAVAQYNEAPSLAERVQQGDLPPVEERLPEEPLVYEPLEAIGEYGGVLRRAWFGPADWAGMFRFLVEGLYRWTPDPAEGPQPNLATSIELTDDATVATIHLRRGVRWSDGEPFTADDILFWYEDLALNPNVDVPVPDWTMVAGERMQMEKVDDYTLTMTFAESQALLTLFLANYMDPLVHPKHYLSQFHPDYSEAITDYTTINEMGIAGRYREDTDHPILSAWTITLLEPAGRLVAERNPYYWKVDSAGNQLPYLDGITHFLVEDAEVLTLRAISGEIDHQVRHLSPIANFPLLMENRERGDYRVLTWGTEAGASVVFHLNQNIRDETKRELWRNSIFRQALSIAIERDYINETVYLGLGTPRQATVIPESPYFQQEFEDAWAQFDIETANTMLDELNLTERNAQGIRLMADGRPLQISLDVAQPAGADMMDIVEMVEEMWEAIGVDLVINPIERSLYTIRVEEADHEAATWGMDGGIEFMNYRHWLVPTTLSRWGPMFDVWYTSGGESGEEPPAEVRRLYELFDQASTTVDVAERVELGRQILELHAENVWMIGTVGMVPQVGIAKNNLRNIPDEAIYGTVTASPGNLRPETWFYEGEPAPEQLEPTEPED